jgi:hypothetical protein
MPFGGSHKVEMTSFCEEKGGREGVKEERWKGKMKSITR